MRAQQAEDLFRQKAIESLATWSDGRPVAVQPRPWIWLATLCVLFALVTGCFLWTAEYSRKESVRGWLVVEPGIVHLAHPESATVVSIEHKAGETVRQGDAIVRLSSDVRLGSGEESAKRSLALLEAQLASVDTRDTLAREQFNADHSALRQQLHSLDDEVVALAGQQQEQALRVQRNVSTVEGARSAYRQGAIARVDMLRHEDQLAALQLAVGRLRQERKALGRKRDELLAARARLGIVLERSLATLEAERGELRQRIAHYEAQRMLTLQSPVDGTVATVDVVAGSTIRPQQLVATIIPAHARLAADVYVPSRAVGLIEPGQEVKLLYDAFPHQQFGMADAEVAAVAGFVSLPKDLPAASGLREAAYKVRLRLVAEHMRSGAQQFPLRPGMGLAAEIMLESRSLAHWFFSPLQVRL